MAAAVVKLSDNFNGRGLTGPRPNSKKMALIVATYKNIAEGTQATVCQLEDGRYSVALVDVDAGAVCPGVRIYKDLDLALARARFVAGPGAELVTP